MGNLFQALSSGLARFVYAWLLPSVLTVGIFVAIVWPRLDVSNGMGALATVTSLTLGALGLSVAFAYGSRPIFQFFEGYLMPRWLASPLQRRQQRRYMRLLLEESHGTGTARASASEELRGYPEGMLLIMPTRLGNALRALETYGDSRFGLDSQTFWYELQSTASDKTWRANEEARAAVDFFMSSVAHLILLVIACVTAAPWCDNPIPVLLVAVVAASLAPAAYNQTVRNIIEWRYAVQALVNLTRPALAEALHLRMPDGLAAERKMWQSMAGLVVHGPHQEYLKVLDRQRMRSDAQLAASNAPSQYTPSEGRREPGSAPVPSAAS